MVTIAKNDPPTIVAEISKNWLDGQPMIPNDPARIGQKFEYVIEVNRRRGYKLHSWSLQTTVRNAGDHHHTNETIVAVFTKENQAK